MQKQFASFSLPLHSGSEEEEQLNKFLRSHTVMRCTARLVEEQRWAVLVEYITKNQKEEKKSGRIDYKEVLSMEDFALFDKMRKVRKQLAERDGLPPYAICTNEQLAKIAEERPASKTAFQQIEGLGQAKTEKYAQSFLDVVNTPGSANTQ